MKSCFLIAADDAGLDEDLLYENMQLSQCFHKGQSRNNLYNNSLE